MRSEIERAVDRRILFGQQGAESFRRCHRSVPSPKPRSTASVLWEQQACRDRRTSTQCNHHHPGDVLILDTCACVDIFCEPVMLPRCDIVETSQWSTTRLSFHAKNRCYPTSKMIICDSYPCFTACCITPEMFLSVLPYIVFFSSLSGHKKSNII